MGQLDAASFLLQCDWSSVKGTRPNRNESLQQSLITAASVGHKQVKKQHKWGIWHLFQSKLVYCSEIYFPHVSICVSTYWILFFLDDYLKLAHAGIWLRLTTNHGSHASWKITDSFSRSRNVIEFDQIRKCLGNNTFYKDPARRVEGEAVPEKCQ